MSEPSKRVLVTGGAGFIGRWVVAELLDQGHRVRAFDDCSSGTPENLAEFKGRAGFNGLIVGDVKDRAQVEALFADDVDVCYHLAAKINVQHSIDAPRSVVDNDIVGTVNVLEAARRQYFSRNGMGDGGDGFTPERLGDMAHGLVPKVVFVSTCMVYTPSGSADGIDEEHPVRGLSPYAACKLAGEHLALSYFHAYGLPVTVLRPFNTFGPWQRMDMEGGVVAVFLRRAVDEEPLLVRGDGRQTRDLLYVKDCARFITSAGFNPAADGEILNAGRGYDISINELAETIAQGRRDIRHVPHDHPQAEIPKLLCDNRKAKRVLGWEPRYDFAEAIAETEAWVRQNRMEAVSA